MRKISIALLPPCLALAGCAGDNPDNVPLYGDWELATEVDSVAIDGIQIPHEKLPAPFLAMEQTEKKCGEPLFIDRDWQQRDIDRKTHADCKLESYEVTPTRVDATGLCTDVAPGADFNPKFRLGIDQSESSFRMVLTMEGTAILPGMEGHHFIKAIAVQEGTRTGDC